MSASTFNFRRAGAAFALLLAAGLLSGCETTGSGAPDIAAAKTPEPPMTRTHAAELCWMATEKADARTNLDKRADIVDKCIADKLNGKKTAAVTPEKSKGKPAPEIKPTSDKPSSDKPTSDKPKAEITPHPSPKPKPKAKTDDKPEAQLKADDDSAEPKPKD